MKIGALITNFESWDLTVESVDALLKFCSYSVSRIVVVDDCSRSTPHKSTCWTHPIVEIHQNASNLGYVKSVNRGFSILSDCDVIILHDCDSKLLMDPVHEIMAKFSEQPKLGALAMHEDMPDGGSRIAGEPEPILAEFIFGQAMAANLYRLCQSEQRRFVAHSCSLVVRKSAFDSIDGFDENFDFLDADVDFSLRLLNYGWKIEAAPNLRCFHRGSGSPQSTRKRVARFHANRYRLLSKHGMIKYELPIKVGLALRHFSEVVCLSAICAVRSTSRTLIREKIAGRLQLLRSVWNQYRVD